MQNDSMRDESTIGRFSTWIRYLRTGSTLKSSVRVEGIGLEFGLNRNQISIRISIIEIRKQESSGTKITLDLDVEYLKDEVDDQQNQEGQRVDREVRPGGELVV